MISSQFVDSFGDPVNPSIGAASHCTATLGSLTATEGLDDDLVHHDGLDDERRRSGPSRRRMDANNEEKQI